MWQAVVIVTVMTIFQFKSIHHAETVNDCVVCVWYSGTVVVVVKKSHDNTHTNTHTHAHANVHGNERRKDGRKGREERTNEQTNEIEGGEPQR